jgi:hypothetical protein
MRFSIWIAVMPMMGMSSKAMLSRKSRKRSFLAMENPT